MTLKEAIDMLSPREQSLFLQQEHAALRMVLAAARAFACETCGGDGMTAPMEVTGWQTDCPACAADRKLARGE